MAGPNPFRAPGAWSSLSFLGKTTVTIPGIITKIDGHDRIESWVVQKAQNASYATTVWRGALLNESIKIDVTLFDASSFAEYEAARTVLQPKPPKKNTTNLIGETQVWNVLNAALNWAGITQVGVRSMGTPRANKDLSWTCTIDLIQYRKPHIAPVGPPPAPKAKVETENDRLAKEVEKAAAELKKP